MLPADCKLAPGFEVRRGTMQQATRDVSMSRSPLSYFEAGQWATESPASDRFLHERLAEDDPAKEASKRHDAFYFGHMLPQM